MFRLITRIFSPDKRGDLRLNSSINPSGSRLSPNSSSMSASNDELTLVGGFSLYKLPGYSYFNIYIYINILQIETHKLQTKCFMFRDYLNNHQCETMDNDQFQILQFILLHKTF